MIGIEKLKAFADSLREKLRRGEEEENERIVKCPVCRRRLFYWIGRHSGLHILRHPHTPTFCALDSFSVRAVTKEAAVEQLAKQSELLNT